ncbi:MAG: SUMF1/EgtB/PvdO family nonheme iron enzyme [Candidatus Krumholzibacteriia bacterium]
MTRTVIVTLTLTLTVLAAVGLAATPVAPIPPGSFVSYDDDGTAITITLTRPYLLQTYPVTAGDFRRYLDATAAELDTAAHHWWDFVNDVGGEAWPVVNVTFLDALGYANWLSEDDGFAPAYDLSGPEPVWRSGADGWRLPTEAEWQFAALCRDGCLALEEPAGAGPVSAAPRNDLGLAGMVDDVLEWCWDGFEPMRRDSLVDPVGDDPAGRRVIRGLGPDAREWAAPGFRSEAVGFRLARTPAASAALDSLLRRQDRAVRRRREILNVEAVADSLYWYDRDRRDRVRRVGGGIGAAGGLAVFIGWSLFKEEDSSQRTQDLGLDLMAVGAGTLVVGALVYLAAGRDLPRDEALRRARELVAVPREVQGTALGVRVGF